MPRKRQKPLMGSAFSQRISQLRKQEGLTMAALSERIGVTPSYISLLEGGDRQPSREIVLKLAAVFFEPEDVDALDELLVLAGLSPTRYEQELQQDDTRMIYQQRLQVNPDDFKSFMALIRLLIRQAELKDAEERIYNGMKRFHDAWQLQALMAHLQLCLKSFETAITFQSAALELYRGSYTKAKLAHNPDFADLNINLGVIYFLWGMEFFDAAMKRESNKASREKKQALEHFRQAVASFEYALSICPEDVFLLDEYARISFNIADLSEAKEKPALWQKAIDRFVAVICAEDVGALGMASVRETNAFLAHAYSKSGHFDEARKLIGVIQSTHPDFWLIYYVKACHFSLRAQSEKADECLDLALRALQQAAQIQHPQNATLVYAPDDPDLIALRQGRSKAFAELLAK